MIAVGVARAAIAAVVVYLVVLFVVGLPFAGADSLAVRDWGFLGCSMVAAAAGGAVGAWQARAGGVRARVAVVAGAVLGPTVLGWAFALTQGENDTVRLLVVVALPVAASAGAWWWLSR